MHDQGPPLSITTQRLVLRPWSPTDAPDLLALHGRSKEPLRRWYGGLLARPEVTLDEVGTYLQEARRAFGTRAEIGYAARDAASGALVGGGVLHHIDWSVPKARIGYFVHADHTGQGHAGAIAAALTRMAFHRLGLQRIEIRVAIGNAASAAIPRKLGYRFLTVFERTKRAANGDLWDLEIHVRHDANGLPDL